MSTDENIENGKKLAYQKVGDTHQATKNATGATQKKAQEVLGEAGKKARQTGDLIGEKWDQAKQGASNMARTPQDQSNGSNHTIGDKWEQTKNITVNKAAAVRTELTPSYRRRVTP